MIQDHATAEEMLAERNETILRLGRVLVAGGLASPQEIAALYRGPGPVVFEMGEDEWRRLNDLYAPHRKPLGPPEDYVIVRDRGRIVYQGSLARCPGALRDGTVYQIEHVAFADARVVHVDGDPRNNAVDNLRVEPIPPATPTIGVDGEYVTVTGHTFMPPVLDANGNPDRRWDSDAQRWINPGEEGY